MNDINIGIKDITVKTGISLNIDREGFYSQIKSLLPYIQAEYVKRVFSIMDPEEIRQKVKNLGHKIEPLIIVDENDIPYEDESGGWGVEFRKDFGNISSVFGVKEKPLFCRVARFIVEDSEGNIIIARRSLKKNHPGELEIPGGHVIAGDSYLETIYHEASEELGYEIPENSVTEDNRLFKYRNLAPGKNGVNGKNYIMTVYNIRVPSVDSLKYDPEEINELKVLTKEELFEAISTGYVNGEEYKLLPHHAYWYLEYLEKKHNFDTKKAREKMIEAGVMKNRIKIPTFGEGE